MENRLYRCNYCGVIHEVLNDCTNLAHMLTYLQICPACKAEGFIQRIENKESTFDSLPLKNNKLHFEFPIRYNETYIPARCRKPRTKESSMIYTYDIPRVDKSKVKALFYVNYLPEYNGYYFLYRGKLYKLANTRDIVATGTYTQELPINTFYFETVLRMENRGYNSKDIGITRCNEYFTQWLIVENQLFKEVKMPCYEVAIFGLGNNHGGTGFMVSLLGHFDRRKRENRWKFYPHDYNKAKQLAITTASSRGDTEDVARFQQYRQGEFGIKILDMELYKKYIGAVK